MPSIPEFGQALSPREMDVLTAFCAGHGTQKEVARHLHISHRTVERHMQNAMVKMGAGTQQQAVLMWDRASCAGPAGALRIAMQEALASLEVGMVGGAVDTLRCALAAHDGG